MDWFTIFEEVIKNLAALNDEIKEILSLLTLLVEAVTKKNKLIVHLVMWHTNYIQNSKNTYGQARICYIWEK